MRFSYRAPHSFIGASRIKRQTPHFKSTGKKLSQLFLLCPCSLQGKQKFSLIYIWKKVTGVSSWRYAQSCDQSPSSLVTKIRPQWQGERPERSVTSSESTETSLPMLTVGSVKDKSGDLLKQGAFHLPCLTCCTS